MGVEQQINEHQVASSSVFSTEMITNIASARGIAFQIAIVAIMLSTATDAEEAKPLMKQRNALCTAFVTRADQALAERLAKEALEGPYATVAAFAGTARDLLSSGEPLDRDKAVAISADVRGQVVPAINQIMGTLQGEHDAAQRDHVAHLEERATILDAMLTDMQRISRMIGLIAINASIEAARTGGDSGKAFTVIAAEVRSLSTESANLLAKTRKALKVNG